MTHGLNILLSFLPVLLMPSTNLHLFQLSQRKSQSARTVEAIVCARPHVLPGRAFIIACSQLHLGPLESVKELFNPDYGMFTYDEAVRLHWFRASRLNMETEFELVGVLIGELGEGLAIYNSHILEFSFPLVLFKKLTGMRPCFQDIQELFPDIHQNLSKLLQMSEEAIAACGLNFTVCTHQQVPGILCMQSCPSS
eukprot:1159589-Pelagomonas_calceolata.AAC.5